MTEIALSVEADYPAAAADAVCFHCGETCGEVVHHSDNKPFCCAGCLTVFTLLTENGLDDFYSFEDGAGVKVKGVTEPAAFKYLDDPAVRTQLADFTDDRLTRITFRVPAAHCIACVWLLENLFRLKPGIGHSRVDFPRKEVSISFETAKVKLSEVVELLASLGYPPDLNLSDMKESPRNPASRRLWLQLGVAGFAFGNIMLLSFSSYLGMDAFSGPGLKKLFGWISLALAIPALAYSGSDYWRAFRLAWRRRILTIEVPIAAGLAALAAWSAGEVFTGKGPGYFDSLAGLLFFLLCGRVFQQKTYDRLGFDRDYKSFFPLSVARKRGQEEERVSLSQLRIGDRLVIRNGELIPADSVLISEEAAIDYSFVTGESEPVEKNAGGHLYAGGKATGAAMTVETVKEVSHSYLASLWNEDSLAKEKQSSLDTLTNRYSHIFTKVVFAVAASSALFWLWRDPSRALSSFVSVLIVACPCALALAAPFAFGAAQRILARQKVFLKNSAVLETLARVDAVVFDKTGTLTAPGAGAVEFWGEPMREEEAARVGSLTRHSTHPCAARITEFIGQRRAAPKVVAFSETAGCGIEGIVDGFHFCIGSAAWLKSRNIAVAFVPPTAASLVYVGIEGKYRGCYALTHALRPEASDAIRRLAAHYELALLSGDNDKERGRFAEVFGPGSELRFGQSPYDKLAYIRQLQAEGKTVMMVGDGLNDAGALKQSDAGVAVVESIGAFSPASDIIMPAELACRLPEVLRFAKRAARVVRLSFAISTIYNIAGIAIAARGLMSPVICAIIMPLSSVTVVVFACGLTTALGRNISKTPARV